MIKQEITNRIVQYTEVPPLLKDAYVPLTAKEIMFENVLTAMLFYVLRKKEKRGQQKEEISRIKAAQRKVKKYLLER